MILMFLTSWTARFAWTTTRIAPSSTTCWWDQGSKSSSNFFSSSFLPGQFSWHRTSVPHCQCFAHSFLFSWHLASGIASSSSFFKICSPPLCKSPALPSALLIIWLTFFLALFFHLLNFTLLLHFGQPVIPLLHNISQSCMEPRFLAVSGQQLTDPPTVVDINSTFCFDFFVISFITFILCYCAWLAFAARFFTWTTRKFLPSNIHSIFEADISWFFEPSSTPEVHLFLCRLLFYCPPSCIFSALRSQFFCVILSQCSSISSWLILLQPIISSVSSTRRLLTFSFISLRDLPTTFLFSSLSSNFFLLVISSEVTSSDTLCVASHCRISPSAFFYFNFSSTLLISSHCFLRSSSSCQSIASPSSTLFSICI